MNSVVRFKNHYDGTPGPFPYKLAKATWDTGQDTRAIWGTGKTVAIDIGVSAFFLFVFPSCRTHMCDPNASIFFAWSCREIIAIPLCAMTIYDAFQHVVKQLREHSENQPPMPAIKEE